MVKFRQLAVPSVVGYNSGNSISENNFVTIPFALVGFNTSDIQQIKISDGGVGGIGYGTENFTVWEGIPTVADGSEFFYWDPSMDLTGEATDYYWGDASFSKATYPIAAGAGFVLNTVDAGLTIVIKAPYSL